MLTVFADSFTSYERFELIATHIRAKRGKDRDVSGRFLREAKTLCAQFYNEFCQKKSIVESLEESRAHSDRLEQYIAMTKILDVLRECLRGVQPLDWPELPYW